MLIKQQKEAAKARMKAKTTTVEEAPAETEESTTEGGSVVSKLIESIEEKPKL